MGSPALRTAQAPPPLPPSGPCLCQEEGEGARRGDGITPMLGGGEGKTQRSATGKAPAWGGGCVGGGWWARSKDQEQPLTGQEAPQRASAPAALQKGEEVAGVPVWGTGRSTPPNQLDAPSHPHWGSNAEFFNQAEGGLGPGADPPPLPAIWACPTISPRQAGSGWVGGWEGASQGQSREAAPRSGRGFWTATTA